jgi:hypothetical protein
LDGFGSQLRKILIVSGCIGRIAVAYDFEHEPSAISDLRREHIKLGHRLVCQNCASGSKEDHRGPLHRVLVKIYAKVFDVVLDARYPGIRLLGRSRRTIGGSLSPIRSPLRVINTHSKVANLLSVSPRGLFKLAGAILERRDSLGYSIANVLLSRAT